MQFIKKQKQRQKMKNKKKKKKKKKKDADGGTMSPTRIWPSPPTETKTST